MAAAPALPSTPALLSVSPVVGDSILIVKPWDFRLLLPPAALVAALCPPWAGCDGCDGCDGGWG